MKRQKRFRFPQKAALPSQTPKGLPNKFEWPIYIYLYWHIKKRGLPTKEKKDKKRKIG